MMVVTLQRLKLSHRLVKASLITCLDFSYRQIWPHGETVSCPYARRQIETWTCNQKDFFTFPNPKLMVDMVGLPLLILKNCLGSLDMSFTLGNKQ